MTSVDKLLLKILNLPESTLDKIPARDARVLKSLAKGVVSPNFITENQSRLLLKILSENSENFGELTTEVVSTIEVPTWSQSFRIADKTKKIFVTPHETTISIEFAFSSQIRKILTGALRDLTNLAQITSGRLYKADLTEKNIVKLVDVLRPHGFEIDEKIEDFYKTIKSWSEIEVKNQFSLNNISYPNFQKYFTNEVGENIDHTSVVANDRKLRYQYFLEKPKKSPENLTEKIAFRENAKIWVNRQEHTLSEIFSSLVELNRLPALVIFDHNDHKRCYEELQNLHKSLEKSEIFDGVGIYFRLPNDEHGTEFNKFIAEHQYNCQLNESTKIVGVQNGKIPKFFLKTDWKPMSVISIGSSLKQTKTAVYANSSDLIISYTDSQPIIESKLLWE